MEFKHLAVTIKLVKEFHNKKIFKLKEILQLDCNNKMKRKNNFKQLTVI